MWCYVFTQPCSYLDHHIVSNIVMWIGGLHERCTHNNPTCISRDVTRDRHDGGGSFVHCTSESFAAGGTKAGLSKVDVAGQGRVGVVG